jgi:hypothetical protein
LTSTPALPALPPLNLGQEKPSAPEPAAVEKKDEKSESMVDHIMKPPDFPDRAPSSPPKEEAKAPEPAQGSTLLPIPTLSKSAVQRLPDLRKGSEPPFPSGPEVSVILAENRFYPSKIRLREGEPIRLVFTTVNPKPAALILEGLGMQRWLKQNMPPSSSEEARARWEVTREIASDRLTEIVLEPQPGTYTFHDALSGATGEITVE